MRGWGERLGATVHTAPCERSAEGLRAGLVIAAPPKHVTDALATVVPPAPGVLFDVFYDPWPTLVAAAWQRAGGAVVGGLDPLIHQAAHQIEQFTRCRAAPLSSMRTAGERAIAAHGSVPEHAAVTMTEGKQRKL